MLGSLRDQKHREYRNALSGLNNAIYTVITTKDTWDNKILMMQKISRLIPYIIRYMIYFKNLEEK